MTVEAPFKSLAVANRFVELANESGATQFSLMKLLKLVYFAHGWHLALTKRPIIDERLEAWKFGPVAPDVYHSFKSCNPLHIEKTAQTLDNLSLDSPINFITPTTPRDPNLESFLKRIWD